MNVIDGQTNETCLRREVAAFQPLRCLGFSQTWMGTKEEEREAQRDRKKKGGRKGEGQTLNMRRTKHPGKSPQKTDSSSRPTETPGSKR